MASRPATGPLQRRGGLRKGIAAQPRHGRFSGEIADHSATLPAQCAISEVRHRQAPPRPKPRLSTPQPNHRRRHTPHPTVRPRPVDGDRGDSFGPPPGRRAGRQGRSCLTAALSASRGLDDRASSAPAPLEGPAREVRRSRAPDASPRPHHRPRPAQERYGRPIGDASVPDAGRLGRRPATPHREAVAGGWGPRRFVRAAAGTASGEARAQLFERGAFGQPGAGRSREFCARPARGPGKGSPAQPDPGH